MPKKIPYICYALTELDPAIRDEAKAFYVRAADACEEILGTRGFVPHEHYDPMNFTPTQVDEAERKQVCEHSSLLVVIALAPSWGGGIEVEMANQTSIPAILLCEKAKLEAHLISRLLRGNPAVKQIIAFTDYDDAITQLKVALRDLYPQPKQQMVTTQVWWCAVCELVAEKQHFLREGIGQYLCPRCPDEYNADVFLEEVLHFSKCKKTLAPEYEDTLENQGMVCPHCDNWSECVAVPKPPRTINYPP